MPLSNHSDTVVRFWRKYRFTLAEAGVKPAALQWYVRHAAAYIEAAAGQRLATHSAATAESWLGELGRVDGMPAWQFTQAVDAVRHLLKMAGRLRRPRWIGRFGAKGAVPRGQAPAALAGGADGGRGEAPAAAAPIGAAAGSISTKSVPCIVTI